MGSSVTSIAYLSVESTTGTSVIRTSEKSTAAGGNESATAMLLSIRYAKGASKKVGWLRCRKYTTSFLSLAEVPMQRRI